MPGPMPKKIEMRQHRIKKVTRATLINTEPALRKPPALPRHPDGEPWHVMTRRFWKDVWKSPMVSEYLLADQHGLFRLAVLIDAFWKKPTVQLSAEIRMMSQLFGLSPIDRRRLEWQVVQSEDAKDKHHRRRGNEAVQIEHDDPRALLE